MEQLLQGMGDFVNFSPDLLGFERCLLVVWKGNKYGQWGRGAVGIADKSGEDEIGRWGTVFEWWAESFGLGRRWAAGNLKEDPKMVCPKWVCGEEING
ncbi:hypothetical protein KY285_019549 [Solanum tuberosum]|nr:hypothetical protein KY285_019549 [Solanum tuberosum]